MCGIHLILDLHQQGEKAIQNMMVSGQHRGPDANGWLKAAESLFLAGNRLQTVDMGAWAHQPITVDQEQAVLVWNGAIYNYETLRNRLLELGTSFESRSDAEVLIRWLQRFGEAGLQDLEGMYALAFVDKPKEKIILARDPYGKKPLYYYQKGHQWIFSSEARSILASGLATKKWDKNQLMPYFYNRHSFPDQSFFQEVKQMLPGQIWTFNFSGERVGESQVNIAHKPIPLPDSQKFNTLLTDAVLKHLQADVPVGIMLSGGVDSSLLWHIWYRETGTPLHTYTAVFPASQRGKYADATFAASISKKYHGAHHEVMITPESILDNWPAYIQSLDQPIGDSASFLSWMIAREAKKSVKILISGAGADELFSGYDRHQAFHYYLKNKSWLLPIAQWVKKLPFGPRRIRKFFQALENSNTATYLHFSALQALPAPYLENLKSYYPEDQNPYSAALLWDQQFYLVNDVLKIHDNALMAHGVEGRAPYLDHGLVSMSQSLSEEQHLSLQPKQWIREILQEEGLGHLTKRKKLGFGLPLPEWLATHSVFRNEVFGQLRHFEARYGEELPAEMRTLAKRPELHVRDSFLQIWNLYVLASWIRYHQL